MKNPEIAQLRELISKLSDGVLTIEEAARLNALLKADPIAQEFYLDQMLIDGLLEREFGHGTADVSLPATVEYAFPGPSHTAEQPRQRRWLTRTVRSPAPLFLAAGVVVSWLLWVIATPGLGQSQRHPLSLEGAGFESGMPLVGATTLEGQWYGDVAEIVGPYSGVSPLEGRRMLRFVKSEFEPDDACELYQLVDVRPMRDAIAKGHVFAEASAFFNAIRDPSVEDYSFGIALFAHAGELPRRPQVWPLRGTQPLSFSGQQEPADTDVETWQPVMTRMPLPPGTTYLLIQVSAVRLKPAGADGQAEFPGHFVDHVDLALVTQPEQARWVRALRGQPASESKQ